MKKIEDIDFEKIDLSEFQDEIKKLKQEFDSIKKNRRLMKILNNYKKKIKKEELKITYNSNINNQKFKSIKIGKDKSIIRKEKYDAETNFLSEEKGNLLPFC